MKENPLRDALVLRPEGLYCPAGDFFIDPVRKVARALITHGHSDHARRGHDTVLATMPTLAIMAERYGQNFCRAQQAVDYGELIRIGNTLVNFHPAGHILGSAQIAIELLEHGTKGRIVVSGDYKRGHDPTCAAFEPVQCNIFITEATFGLPVYHMPDPVDEIGKLLSSRDMFSSRTHMVGCYSLGKAQRLAALIRTAGYERPIYLHGSMIKMMALYQRFGVDFGDLRPVSDPDKPDMAGEIILCPLSAISDEWSRNIPDPLACFASGWMRIRAHARRRNIELPLIISDHADWDELTQTIAETGCEEVWITHGSADALVRWAELHQLRAQPLDMIGYGHEDRDDAETAEEGFGE